jgi:hypothetical protein
MYLSWKPALVAASTPVVSLTCTIAFYGNFSNSSTFTAKGASARQLNLSIFLLQYKCATQEKHPRRPTARLKKIFLYLRVSHPCYFDGFDTLSVLHLRKSKKYHEFN